MNSTENINPQMEKWIHGLNNRPPLIAKFEEMQIKQLSSEKKIDEFRAGDTLEVTLNIFEDGEFIRTQIFSGICIAIENRGLCTAFVVRKVSHGVAVEKKIPLHANTLHSVKVLKRGKVRRAKLYYLRNLSGKKARIKSEMVKKK